MTELTNYKITEHAKQRYATRILGKENQNEVTRFVTENENKIKTDINKMITYGQKIYSGKQSQKDGKGKVLDVYLKDTWVVLVDNSANNVVTLYRIDLSCGDDFNLQYIEKMLDKLNQNKDTYESIKQEVSEEQKIYQGMIEDAQAQINEYKCFIKNLESLCNAYQTIISNNTVKCSQAEREVAETLNTLIGKREF